MRADRHDVRCAVRQPHRRARQRDLHHVLGEIARRMCHVLMRGRDRQSGRVIVSAEVGSGDTSTAGGNKIGKRDPALGGDDRLRGFDHEET